MKRGASQSTSLALCVFDAERDGSAIRILPAGEFRARDGRPQGVDAWRLDQADAERLINVARARRVDYPVDYEHQTLLTEKNGQPAPAAGWFRALEWREDGLWATDVRWTARAREMLDAGEYRYLSPVFSYDGGTGHVASLHSVALTNNPALDDLDDLYLRAAARYGAADHSDEEDTMHPAMLKLLARFGLPAEHTDEQLAAAVAALSTQLEKLDQVEADLTALRTKMPDLSAYVSKDKHAALRAELDTATARVTELEQKVTAAEVEQIVATARAEGRIASDEEAAKLRDVGKHGLEALRATVALLKPNDGLPVALTMQTKGKAPADPAAGVTDEQVALRAKEYRKRLAAAGHRISVTEAVDAVHKGLDRESAA